jgi:hypothetical protein
MIRVVGGAIVVSDGCGLNVVDAVDQITLIDIVMAVAHGIDLIPLNLPYC